MNPINCFWYIANILTPFSPLVAKKIKEVLSFNLPLDVICTSYGVIWREKPEQIVEDYLKWADNYQENQITIIMIPCGTVPASWQSRLQRVSKKRMKM